MKHMNPNDVDRAITGLLKGLAEPSDMERDRQERVAELAAEGEANQEELNLPGTFGCHELLDRTSIAADAVERLVQSHPACVRNPEWSALAALAVAALNELYQRVGADHLGAKEESAPAR